MTKTRTIGLAVIFALGLGAVLLLVGSQLASSYSQRSEAATKTAPPPLLLTPPATGAASEQSLLAATSRTPQDAVAWTKLGDRYMTDRKFAQAVDAYRKATAANPGHATGWSALGEAYVQTIRSTSSQLPPEARQAFERAIAINRDDFRARFYLAMEKDFQGDHDGAINDWVLMLANVPLGSQADEAIRAAITASMGRSAIILRARVNEAMRAQKKLSPSAALAAR